jgi:hypothetical protein
MRKAESSDHLLTKISGNCLILQLPERVIKVGANEVLPKVIKRFVWVMRGAQEALKSFDIFLGI